MEMVDIEYIREKLDSAIEEINSAKLVMKDMERDYIERDVKIMAKTMDEIEKSVNSIRTYITKEFENHVIKCNIADKLKVAIELFDEAKKIYQNTKNTFIFTLVTSVLSIIVNVILHLILGR